MRHGKRSRRYKDIFIYFAGEWREKLHISPKLAAWYKIVRYMYMFLQFHPIQFAMCVCVALRDMRLFFFFFWATPLDTNTFWFCYSLALTQLSLSFFLLLADATRISRGAAWRCLHAPTSWDITTADIRGCLPGAYVHIVKRELSVCLCAWTERRFKSPDKRT